MAAWLSRSTTALEPASITGRCPASIAAVQRLIASVTIAAASGVTTTRPWSW